jgi:hypothetical protein
MIAYRLVAATVEDMVGNFPAAFRISLPSILALVAIFGLILGGVALGPQTSELAQFGTGNVDLDGPAAVAMLGAAVLAIIILPVGLAWTAVAWHRFLCLGERPQGLLPAWPRGLIGGYVLRVIGIALLLMLATLAFFPFLAFADKGPSGEVFLDQFGVSDPLTAKNVVLGLVIGVLVNALSLRFSMILPAYAVGRPLPAGATAGAFWPIFVPLALFMTVGFLAMDLAAMVFPVSGITEAAVIWLQFMFGIGILTRAFLHFVPDAADVAA